MLPWIKTMFGPRSLRAIESRNNTRALTERCRKLWMRAELMLWPIVLFSGGLWIYYVRQIALPS
jgi:hypothetical protein